MKRVITAVCGISLFIVLNVAAQEWLRPVYISNGTNTVITWTNNLGDVILRNFIYKCGISNQVYSVDVIGNGARTNLTTDLAQMTNRIVEQTAIVARSNSAPKDIWIPLEQLDVVLFTSDVTLTNQVDAAINANRNRAVLFLRNAK